MSSSKRAAARRRGKRKEADKVLKKEQAIMWKKLTNTTFKKVEVGYKGASGMDAPAFYCPYIPLVTVTIV